MPTYAYACTACDYRFEAQQAFSDSSLTECPECQGRLRKVFNAVGVVFKGSGFYRNDSRATAGSSSSSSTSEGSSSGSGDAANGSSTPAKEKTGSPKESAGSGSSGSGASTSAASGS